MEKAKILLLFVKWRTENKVYFIFATFLTFETFFFVKDVQWFSKFGNSRVREKFIFKWAEMNFIFLNNENYWLDDCCHFLNAILSLIMTDLFFKPMGERQWFFKIKLLSSHL